VWAVIADVRGHVDWMGDAEAIRLTSEQAEGVGTTFECDTRVGPLRTTDVMTITEWVPGEALGVRHVGLVTGEGRFTLDGDGRGGTRFTWSESLAFPWWMGGPVLGLLARPALRAIWKRNLSRLQEQFAI